MNSWLDSNEVAKFVSLLTTDTELESVLEFNGRFTGLYCSELIDERELDSQDGAPNADVCAALSSEFTVFWTCICAAGNTWFNLNAFDADAVSAFVTSPVPSTACLPNSDGADADADAPSPDTAFAPASPASVFCPRACAPEFNLTDAAAPEFAADADANAGANAGAGALCGAAAADAAS